MRPALTAIAAAVASVGLLAGCAPQVPVPEEPSAYAVIAASEKQLQVTWDLTGLPGDRPQSRLSPGIGSDWQEGVTACLQVEGIGLRRIRADGDGYRPVFGRGVEVTATMQYAWFRCFAENRPTPTIASKSQLEYLWNYYHRWVIPCVRLQGYELNKLPEKQQFMQTGSFQWSPYGATTQLLSDEQYIELVAVCGPERGIIGA